MPERQGRLVKEKERQEKEEREQDAMEKGIKLDNTSIKEKRRKESGLREQEMRTTKGTETFWPTVRKGERRQRG